MSMMAGKKVGKETFVPIYDVSHKNKFYGSNQAGLKNHLAKQRRHKQKDDFSIASWVKIFKNDKV